MKNWNWKKIKKFGLPALFSLALSACGSAGLYCLLTWYNLVCFGEIGISPIDYRASIIVGVLMLFACVMIALFYVISRHKNFTIRGILLDLGVLLVAFMPFYALWDVLYNWLSHIV